MSTLNALPGSRVLRLGLALALGGSLLGALLLLVGATHSQVVALARGATPAVRYVASSGNDAGNDCANSSAPCATVQHAVDVADSGDEIRVATGVYTDVQARPRDDVVATGVVTQVVYISKTVTIRGGYSSGDWGAPNPEANPTTLDAQGQGRVLYVTGSISPTIEGLHITGGNATGLGGEPLGTDTGGGAYVITATVSFSGNWVFSNTASSITTSNTLGGGLYQSHGSAALYGNYVTSNTAAFGGGLYFIDSSDVSLVANFISGNRAGRGHGGGLYFNNSSDAVLASNTIVSNTASGPASNFGGGAYFLSSDGVIVTANIVRGNLAEGGGSGLHFQTCSNVRLDRNIISSNRAGSGGGLLFLTSSSVTLTNNAIIDNRVDTAGGGLVIQGSALQLAHNTIARNSGGGGSGVYVLDSGPIYSTVTLTNTILVSHAVGITVASGNTATLEATLWSSGAWANETDTEGAGVIITGTVNITGDPAFIDPDAGDYHIGPGSAARDMGITTTVSHDIDGDPRPIGHGYDLGADEWIAYVFLPVIFKNYNPLQIEVSGILHAGDVCVMCCYPTSLETADKIYELTLIGWSQYDGYYVKVRGILQNPCGLSLWPLISVISIEVLGPPP